MSGTVEKEKYVDSGDFSTNPPIRRFVGKESCVGGHTLPGVGRCPTSVSEEKTHEEQLDQERRCTR